MQKDLWDASKKLLEEIWLIKSDCVLTQFAVKARNWHHIEAKAPHKAWHLLIISCVLNWRQIGKKREKKIHKDFRKAKRKKIQKYLNELAKRSSHDRFAHCRYSCCCCCCWYSCFCCCWYLSQYLKHQQNVAVAAH